MVFSSSVFLFAFFPVTVIGFWLLRNNLNLQNTWLLFVSILFYAWGEPTFVFILLLSSVINWIIGERIKLSSDFSRKRWLLIISLVFNLGIFVVFKYLGFIINNVEVLIGVTLPNPHIRLPIGISFYSFQVMSYQIDLYRDEDTEKTSLRDFMLYALMFPQLVAGPIVRFKDIAINLKVRNDTFSKYSEGLQRFVIGLSKKVLLADQLAMLSDNAYFIMNKGGSVATAWIGAIAYYLQLYYDFSGYSDMAIGLGKIFGFSFPENFDYPYISSSIKEFWRRWHMTLSGWFRDYVYIPLGGSRKGKRRTLINLFIIWLLTGLWHGAGWNYILWGLGYFVIMNIEKVLLKHLNIPKIIGHVYTLVITISLQVIFHSTELASGLYYVKCMYGGSKLFDNNSVELITSAGMIPIIAVIFCYPWRDFAKKMVEKTRISSGNQAIVRGLVLVSLFVLCMAMCVTENYSPFVYFNF